MSQLFWACLLFSLFGVVGVVRANAADGDAPLVFVSAFAPGEDGAIHAFSLDVKTGQLELLARTTDVENPFFLALSADQRFLYSIHAPGQFGGKNDEFVAAFSVEGRTGRLKLLNRQTTRGRASCYLDVSAEGKAVVAANYSTGSVVSYPVNSDGSLAAPISFFQHSGSSVNQQRQEGPHAHCSVVTPDDRFVLVADLGIDKIMIYRLDPTTGKLTEHRPSFVNAAAGAGPRHLTFHPNGKQVYVVNELGNSVTLYDYEKQLGTLIKRQTLSTLPDGYDGTTKCADVKLTPNGKYLYATNRGHDSLAAYRIDDNGKMTLIEIRSSLGEGPQNLAITKDGQWLLCANMPGNTVVVFRIDQKTGKLTPVGDAVAMPGPSCIMMLE